MRKLNPHLTCPHCVMTYTFLPGEYLVDTKQTKIPDVITLDCGCCGRKFLYHPFRSKDTLYKGKWRLRCERLPEPAEK